METHSRQAEGVAERHWYGDAEAIRADRNFQRLEDAYERGRKLRAEEDKLTAMYERIIDATQAQVEARRPT